MYKMYIAWVAVDKSGDEAIYAKCPERESGYWSPVDDAYWMFLPKGSILKLIGRELTWEDEPVELKDEE